MLKKVTQQSPLGNTKISTKRAKAQLTLKLTFPSKLVTALLI